MKLQVLLFGITSDLLKTPSITIDVKKNSTIDNFKFFLQEKYPQLKNIQSYAIAVNEKYASDKDVLKENDVVAIIPPVSGG